ncbi:PA2169 family four-helix-bundle protein [Chitinophaga silvatica]|uniref:PA2169 family four-helix-bundle protein n=1 Tax=Chitinophaga silvatica TaxID=2282649 RepID=A0A3E1Y9A5_9BACT|nr:PA2169 family four-helix-bundle protein [Chitinophaga silvatica]RFS21970.1 PA2169 family four-helix-bundle protein [Chitinophaga silvatica]
METPTTTITNEVLNDLIAINNDRIAGYEKAIKEIKNADPVIKELFMTMINDSREYRNTLGVEVQAAGGTMETGTTAAGKLYRTWMDIKSAFSGTDVKSILSSCVTGEEAAQRAYKSALEHKEIPANIRLILVEEKAALKASLDRIKAYYNDVKDYGEPV